MHAIWRYVRLCYLLATAYKNKERLQAKILKSHGTIHNRYIHEYFKLYGVDDFYIKATYMRGGTKWKKK